MGNQNSIAEHVSNFRHDIRNPLYIAKSLIETHLEYLESSEEKATLFEKTKTVLSKSVKSIDRVLNILQRMNQLAVSPTKNSAGHCVSIKHVLDHILKALSEAHYLDHLLLIKSIPGDLPLLEVHLTDLEEVFFNLIVNASQATQKGGRLWIEALFNDSYKEPAITLLFKDTGCGISEEAMPYIFEPFCTGRAHEGGVGFGLYIVKQLVERNGGTISVESHVGQGTTFQLIFKIQRT